MIPARVSETKSNSYNGKHLTGKSSKNIHLQTLYDFVKHRLQMLLPPQCNMTYNDTYKKKYNVIVYIE